jgi:Outer membrane protein beta-barrel domain
VLLKIKNKIMRKIVFSLIIVIAMVIKVNAQTNKGDWMVGGNMTINTTSGNSQFILQPSAGYFFAKNFVAGSELLLSFQKIEQTKLLSIGVGPFGRYYFDLKNSNFKPFIHTSLNFATTTVKSDFDPKNSFTSTSFFIGGGGAYFINSNVALEAMAGFNRSKVETSDAANGFLFRVGFQVHLLGHEVSSRSGN